ncbi:MAG: GGDEF domain-containing protein [Bacilli bacterium]|jgi:diguanylate cyclase (GGDEF)-like protein|nr:GGDEF domain-containing protein [Bacilli bacterium]
MVDLADEKIDKFARLSLESFAEREAVYFTLPDGPSLFTCPFRFLSGDAKKLGFREGPVSFSSFLCADFDAVDSKNRFSCQRCLAMTKELRHGNKDHFEFGLSYFTGKNRHIFSCYLSYLKDKRVFLIALRRLKSLEPLFANLIQKAFVDSTTGLENKDVCLRAINSLPLDGKSYVVFMDLNSFKLVNDVYGHAEGDLILKKFAMALKENKSKCLEPYRFGGDEFVVIARDCSEKYVCDYLDRVQDHFSLSLKEKTCMSFSAGIMKARGSLDSPLSLITLSDRAMYLAKKKGLPYYVISDREMNYFLAHPMKDSLL